MIGDPPTLCLHPFLRFVLEVHHWEVMHKHSITQVPRHIPVVSLVLLLLLPEHPFFLLVPFPAPLTSVCLFVH